MCILNAHAERTITQSGNENITHRKVISSNQLKSRDLSIKTAGVHKGRDTDHHIRSSCTQHTYQLNYMNRFKETRDQIVLDNKPFIPQAEIGVIIEFNKPGDANKIKDEGLVYQDKVFQCERYERTVPIEAVLQVPILRPHWNQVQGNNRMWLPCTRTREPALLIETGPDCTQKKRDVPRRPRSVDLPVSK
ncbi:hypothetical protein HBI56_188050 [Parastagonospora nodorum]|nr:hypothetical protein HBH53_111640 [Parastagonospora nodorum]KAH3960089.1 hypothetical protein HBH51_195480 [Parastagonospora nodorum]KAH3997767.1 hypothetical protein HBI10_134630 [Parastagonospora nodorum]KAH4020660.1 hypothetical protein HBI13_117850 [Parastagonospora nodorum]KAH4101815.1 hypothetical protein HBH46_132140 [Parastagonospora nodorum]